MLLPLGWMKQHLLLCELLSWLLDGWIPVWQVTSAVLGWIRVSAIPVCKATIVIHTTVMITTLLSQDRPNGTETADEDFSEKKEGGRPAAVIFKGNTLTWPAEADLFKGNTLTRASGGKTKGGPSGRKKVIWLIIGMILAMSTTPTMTTNAMENQAAADHTEAIPDGSTTDEIYMEAQTLLAVLGLALTPDQAANEAAARATPLPDDDENNGDELEQTNGKASGSGNQTQVSTQTAPAGVPMRLTPTAHACGVPKPTHHDGQMEDNNMATQLTWAIENNLLSEEEIEFYE